MAKNNIEELAGSLSDLNKVTVESGVQFQGFAKQLIQMSDPISKAGKKWTIFGRLVSGSPLWRLQNKVRAFVDILAQIEQSSQANAEAAEEQNQRVIKQVQLYKSLEKPLKRAEQLQSTLTSRSRLDSRLQTARNQELKKAIEGTLEYNKAILEGDNANKAYKKGLTELISKGKEQVKMFEAAQKTAKFERDIQTEKGRRKILKDIRKQQEEITLARPKFKDTAQAIKGKTESIAFGTFDALLKTQEITEKVMDSIKNEGLIKTAGKVFDKVAGWIAKSEKLQKLRIRVAVMALAFFGFLKPIFSYLFKALILMVVVIGIIMLAVKVLFDTYDLMGDLPFFFDLVKLVGGAILNNLVLIFQMIGALLGGDIYTFIDYALEFVDGLLIIGFGLLGILAYGAVAVIGGLFFSALDTVWSYFTGYIPMLFGGEAGEFTKAVNKILLKGLLVFAAVYAAKHLAIQLLSIAIQKGFMILLPVILIGALIGAVKFLLKNIGSLFFSNGGVTQGGLSVVGEKGPELVTLPKGSRVHSNKDSAAMVGKTSNVVNNVNVTINAKDTSDAELRRIADQVGNMITNKINRSVSSSGMVR